MGQNKEIVRAQALLWGKLKEKFLEHQQQTQMTAGGLVKFILSEYYSKVNQDFNK